MRAAGVRDALGPAALLAAVLTSTACGPEGREAGREGAGVIRVDSAGVEIVRNAEDGLRRGELVTPAECHSAS